MAAVYRNGQQHVVTPQHHPTPSQAHHELWLGHNPPINVIHFTCRDVDVECEVFDSASTIRLTPRLMPAERFALRVCKQSPYKHAKRHPILVYAQDSNRRNQRDRVPSPVHTPSIDARKETRRCFAMSSTYDRS